MLSHFNRKLGRALKVVVVVIALVLGQHGVPFGPQGGHINAVHRFEISRVKAGAEQRVLLGLKRSVRRADGYS